MFTISRWGFRSSLYCYTSPPASVSLSKRTIVKLYFHWACRSLTSEDQYCCLVTNHSATLCCLLSVSVCVFQSIFFRLTEHETEKLAWAIFFMFTLKQLTLIAGFQRRGECRELLAAWKAAALFKTTCLKSGSLSAAVTPQSVWNSCWHEHTHIQANNTPNQTSSWILKLIWLLLFDDIMWLDNTTSDAFAVQSISFQPYEALSSFGSD